MLHHLFIFFLQLILRFRGGVGGQLLKEIISLCKDKSMRSDEHGKMRKILSQQ